MLDNPNKFFVFLFSLFLFGCSTQGAPTKQVETNPIKVHCYPLAAQQFLRWDKANGKALNGLKKRRQQEMNLFMASC